MPPWSINDSNLVFRQTLNWCFSYIRSEEKFFCKIWALKLYSNLNHNQIFSDLSDERFGVKLRVTENRCVVFDFSTYVCFALLPQHWALYAEEDRTYICICLYIHIYIKLHIYILFIICLVMQDEPNLALWLATRAGTEDGAILSSHKYTNSPLDLPGGTNEVMFSRCCTH